MVSINVRESNKLPNRLFAFLDNKKFLLPNNVPKIVFPEVQSYHDKDERKKGSNYGCGGIVEKEGMCTPQKYYYFRWIKE